MKLFDIAVNLTDEMFMGIYRGKSIHSSDLAKVLERARNNSVVGMMITGTDLKTGREAIELANEHSLYSTVGCHPTNCANLTDSDLDEMYQLLANDRVKAIGEIGLDRDRTQFCPFDKQIEWFRRQLQRFQGTNLPLFLHNRNTDEFYDIIREYRNNYRGGVVHSFDGNLEHVKKCIELDLFIGINGCSLKTQENLSVLKQIPIDRILIETDAPWCDIRPTHASKKFTVTEFKAVKKEKHSLESLVKGRNEPCTLIQVLEVVAATLEISIDECATKIYENTTKLLQIS